MSQITAISPQKKDQTRCNIEVDGRFFCGMNLETVLKNHLKAGMEISEEDLAAAQLEGEKADALDKALSHISASMKTEREIRDFLKKKGYLDDVTEYVVEKMKGYGYIDDRAFAISYARSAGKKKGARAITLALRMKGVGEEDIEAALSELGDGKETAKLLLEKYLRGKTLDTATRRKAFSYLLSKGFDPDTVRSLLSPNGDDED